MAKELSKVREQNRKLKLLLREAHIRECGRVKARAADKVKFTTQFV